MTGYTNSRFELCGHCSLVPYFNSHNTSRAQGQVSFSINLQLILNQFLPEYQHDCTGRSQILKDELFWCPLLCLQECCHSSQPVTISKNWILSVKISSLHVRTRKQNDIRCNLDLCKTFINGKSKVLSGFS